MINQKFDYLYAENGRLKAVVVDKNGEPQVTDVTPDKPYSQSLITDGQGDTLVVSKKGQVMGVKEYKFAGDDRHLLNEYHRQLDSLGEWQINFTPAKDQTYAFDQIGSGNHGIFATDQYYPKSGNYDFRYKSVECGKNDKVIVDYGSYPQADSVIFKDKYGVKLKVVDGNILTFTGVSKADTNFIYAYRGDKKIGKLFLNTYQKKTYKVVLVSVNGAGLPDIGTLETYLNKVYNQCAVKFEISIEEFDLRDLTSFSHGGSGILSVYNEDQKKVLSAYEKEKKMTDGVFYLFFIDNVTDKKDGSGTPVSGYMPRGYNAGFIYDGGSPHTIAHELGHGVAGLEHVFENSSNSGKTANLMDYASGSELWHFQWDQIQDPSRVWMKWNTDEGEGENVSTSKMVCINDAEALKLINQYKDFYLPDNTVVHINNPYYTASGFIVSDDIKEDQLETLGSLAGIRYLGGDYRLYYKNNAELDLTSFRYQDDNQYSTLVKTEQLKSDGKGHENDAVRVFVTQNRLTITRLGTVLHDINIDNNFDCLQPPAQTLSKYYFETKEVETTNKDFVECNDIAQDEIVNMFVSKIKDNPKKYIDDNISKELKSTIWNYQDNYHLIIKFIQVNKLSYNQESWQQLAKKVYKQLQTDNHLDYENKLLITIPYVKVSYPGFDKYFYMPGFYYSSKIMLKTSFAVLYKNISSKITFEVNDTNEPLILFLLDLYNGLEQLFITDNVKAYDTDADAVFDEYNESMRNYLVELNKLPNLKKPKIKVWIDTDYYKFEQKILKEYIEAAFINCVDFYLGYDLEFVDNKNGGENDIVVGITLADNLSKNFGYIPKGIAGQVGERNFGATPVSPSLPIWVDYSIKDYSFMSFALFHEVCHRISKLGAESLSYLKLPIFDGYKQFDNHDNDLNSMMSAGGSDTNYTKMNGKNYSINEMVANKSSWSYNPKRKFVVLYQLLQNIKDNNDIH